jgi:hypothetical protein
LTQLGNERGYALRQPWRRPSSQFHGPVIVAVITMRVMQTAIYNIVHMVAVRDRLMSAVWAVCVRAVNLRRALDGIGCADRDNMFVHMILVHMVKMAVVKIVNMAVVADRSMPAIRTMLMSVVGVVFLSTCGHWPCSF